MNENQWTFPFEIAGFKFVYLINPLIISIDSAFLEIQNFGLLKMTIVSIDIISVSKMLSTSLLDFFC